MSSESEIENEIHEAHFAIPPLDISTADAKALVRASPVTLFCDLKPGQPGVAAKTWQELATVATEPINICWLGRQPDPFGDYVDYNEVRLRSLRSRGFSSAHPLASPRPRDRPTDRPAPQVHADDRVQTNLRYQGHCDRFGEKALKHGGIDIVLRTLHEFEKCHGAAFRVGYNGVKDVFHEAYYGNSLLRTLPKHEFFLDNYDRLIAPRLLAVKRRKEEEAVEAQRVEDAKPENVAKRAEETELAMELAASMGMKPDRESPQSRPQAPPPPYQPPTRQAVANEILAKNLENDWNENGASTEEALRACRRALGAQMVACYPPRYGGGEKDAQRAFERHGLTGWDTLEYMRDECAPLRCPRPPSALRTLCSRARRNLALAIRTQAKDRVPPVHRRACSRNLPPVCAGGQARGEMGVRCRQRSLRSLQ